MGEPRPCIHPSLASDIKSFYLSEYVISLGSKDSLVRRRDRRFDLPIEVFPSAILQTIAYSSTCLLSDTFDLCCADHSTPRKSIKYPRRLQYNAQS
jgi:hypothetical protein